MVVRKIIQVEIVGAIIVSVRIGMVAYWIAAVVFGLLLSFGSHYLLLLVGYNKADSYYGAIGLFLIFIIGCGMGHKTVASEIAGLEDKSIQQTKRR